jgi:predicted nucleic acid-binding protein
VIRAEVVDASAIVAMVFAEPGSEASAQQLEGCQLLAPTMMPYEVANALWVKVRRDLERHDALFEQFRGFLNVRIEHCDVDLEAVVSFGLKRGLTVYDASYVWLALSRGARLVTLDRQMIAVASAAGVR